MESNFESQQFRDELAKKIIETPKNEREEILAQAKQTPEYWQARSDKIHERENEEEIDGGLGVLVKRKTLYHGSGTSGIKRFDEAEDDTVGSGIYFTSEANAAIGYAIRRSKRERDPHEAYKFDANSVPTIYESSVESMRLLDLRKDDNVKKILGGFKQFIREKLKDPELPYIVSMGIGFIIEKIDSGKIGAGNLKDVAQSQGPMFTDYCKSLGYEGLITFEGGEGEDVGNHDTYVIFDPERAKIVQEQNIK